MYVLHFPKLESKLYLSVLFIAVKNSVYQILYINFTE